MNRNVTINSITLPVYRLSMAKDSQRMKMAMGRYLAQLGCTTQQFQRLWSPVLQYAEFSSQQQGTGKTRHLNDGWDSLVDKNASNYLAWAEISQYLSFSRVCLDIVQNKHRRALFMEDDFNFIPMLDSHVFDTTTRKPIME